MISEIVDALSPHLDAPQPFELVLDALRRYQLILLHNINGEVTPKLCFLTQQLSRSELTRALLALPAMLVMHFHRLSRIAFLRQARRKKHMCAALGAEMDMMRIPLREFDVNARHVRLNAWRARARAWCR